MDRYSSLLFTIFITSLSAEITVHKSYNESRQLNCPSCDSNECPISTNGVNTTATSAGYPLLNRQLDIPPYDWDSYGTICCGAIGRQSCYIVCPYEICRSCLTLSVNVTRAIVGNVIMVIASIKQRPHNGITLFINDKAFTDRSADLSCSTQSKVLGEQVVYYCTARKSGTMTIITNTEFCGTQLNSLQIDITIEEQRIIPTHESTPNNTNTTSVIMPATTTTTTMMTIVTVSSDSTSTVTTTTTTMMTIVTVSSDSTSTVTHNSTAANIPTEPSRVSTDNFDLPTGLIVGIVIGIISLLILLVVTIILVVICMIKKRYAKQGMTVEGPINLEDLDRQEVHTPVTVSDDSSEIEYGSIDSDRLQYDNDSVSELTSQQPDQCEQSHVVQQ